MPSAISVRKIRMLEPLVGRDVMAISWKRARKPESVAQVWQTTKITLAIQLNCKSD